MKPARQFADVAPLRLAAVVARALLALVRLLARRRWQRVLALFWLTKFSSGRSTLGEVRQLATAPYPVERYDPRWVRQAHLAGQAAQSPLVRRHAVGESQGVSNREVRECGWQVRDSEKGNAVRETGHSVPTVAHLPRTILATHIGNSAAQH